MAPAEPLQSRRSATAMGKGCHITTCVVFLLSDLVNVGSLLGWRVVFILIVLNQVLTLITKRLVVKLGKETPQHIAVMMREMQAAEEFAEAWLPTIA